MNSEIFSPNQLKNLIRDVKDFPKPGIVFKDITPILSHAAAFRSMVHHLSEMVPPATTHLVAVESRGFLLGAAIAQQLGKALVLVRKPGKLPFATLTHSYDLEYGKDSLQIHVDALKPGDKAVIIDDVLATGGTAAATEALCKECGATILGAVFLMELSFLNGRSRLKTNVHSLLSF